MGLGPFMGVGLAEASSPPPPPPASSLAPSSWPVPSIAWPKKEATTAGAVEQRVAAMACAPMPASWPPEVPMPSPDEATESGTDARAQIKRAQIKPPHALKEHGHAQTASRVSPIGCSSCNGTVSAPEAWQSSAPALDRATTAITAQSSDASPWLSRLAHSQETADHIGGRPIGLEFHCCSTATLKNAQLVSAAPTQAAASPFTTGTHSASNVSAPAAFQSVAGALMAPAAMPHARSEWEVPQPTSDTPAPAPVVLPSAPQSAVNGPEPELASKPAPAPAPILADDTVAWMSNAMPVTGDLGRVALGTTTAGVPAGLQIVPVVRKPTMAHLCRLSGPGLREASVWQRTVFCIEAFDDCGVRQCSGGDTFFIAIRCTSQGTRIRAKVTDDSNGSYTVAYKPPTSGHCTISVSLMGEPLPGSPFRCLIHALRPCAAMCKLSGDALHHAVAHKPQHFLISFRDSLGHLAHSEELDVHVERELSPEAQRSLASNADYSSIGSTAYSLMDGLMPANGLGEDEDHASPEEGRDSLSPLGLHMLRRASAPAAPPVLESASPASPPMPVGNSALSTCNSSAATDQMGHEEGLAFSQRRELSARSMGSASVASAYSLVSSNGTTGAEPQLVHAAATTSTSLARLRETVHGRCQGTHDRIMKAGLVKPLATAVAVARRHEETITVGQRSLVVSRDVATDSERIGRVTAGSTVRVLRVEPWSQEGEGSAKSYVRAYIAFGEKTSKGKDSWRKVYTQKPRWRDAPSWRKHLSDDAPQAQTNGARIAGAPASQVCGARGSSLSATSVAASASDATTTASNSGGNSSRRGGKKAAPVYGWVTVSTSGLQLAVKSPPRLRAHERQQHLHHWTRRVAIDTAREHNKAMVKEEELEEARQDGIKHGANGSPRARSPTKTCLSSDPVHSRHQDAYNRDRRSDPTRIGFAFGGIHPGRLHSHGKLIEKHTVRYSIGATGTYLLHIGLRGQGAALPGSPYSLVVRPGPAHALSTRISPSDLPLRGALELMATCEGQYLQRPRCVCRLRLNTRDRMGNLCNAGGANIRCGCTDPTCAVESSFVDQEDGSYQLSWWSEAGSSGVHEVFIKLDRLHVLGSPTVMQLTSAPPDLSKTVVDGRALTECHSGKKTIVRIRLHDTASNPALPGPNRCFGVSYVPSNETRSDAWRSVKPHPTSQAIVGPDIELSFEPTTAGHLKLTCWTILLKNDRVKQQTSAEDRIRASALRRRGAVKAAEETDAAMVGLGALNIAGVGRPPAPNAQQFTIDKNRLTLEQAKLDERLALPGAPYPMHVTPGPASAKSSFIEGLKVNVHGTWELIPDAVAANDVGREGRERIARSRGMNVAKLATPSQDDCTLHITDSVRITPRILDAYGNSVTADDEALQASVKAPGGVLEEVHFNCFRAHMTGVWAYEARYEMRSRGKHELNIFLDGEPIAGSPVEWFIRPVPFRPTEKNGSPATRTIG